MSLSKPLSLLFTLFTVLALVAPTASEAKPRGRGWSSLGVAGFEGGPCVEIWVRNHWWHGWQVVEEPVPCPDQGSIQGPHTGVFFADAVAFVSLEGDGSVGKVFGEPVSFTLEPSDTYVGPVLTYGAKEATLVELTPDAEKVSAVRIAPEAYPDAVWVRDSHDVAHLFSASNQAALVTLSDDGSSIKQVHTLIQVEPVK